MIRPYTSADRAACLQIFESNTPRYFAEEEKAYFETWLLAQEDGVPAYPNTASERYYVSEQDGKIVACGGYYIVKNEPRASIAWGMVNNELHKQGFGRDLLACRMNEIRNNHPGHTMFLDTSQHTFPFFEKMGFKVVKVTADYYGLGLDRYDMEIRF